MQRTTQGLRARKDGAAHDSVSHPQQRCFPIPVLPFSFIHGALNVSLSHELLYVARVVAVSTLILQLQPEYSGSLTIIFIFVYLKYGSPIEKR